jgi:hypothetical protein
MLLTNFLIEGPNQDEFEFLIEYRGHVLSRGEVRELLPLVLYPSEFLLVGGRFFPQGDGPRYAEFIFVTNSTKTPYADVAATGNTVPSAAIANVVGDYYFAPVGTSNLLYSIRNYLILNNGSTPLIVHRITTSQPFLIGGTTTELPPTPETGHLADRVRPVVGNQDCICASCSRTFRGNVHGGNKCRNCGEAPDG